ncbi:MAG: hypothetical protein IPN32_23055 [Deltaproteobacteria bacterium]|nr:hypothetical protein [Deltaproteobacteria bacterium]
MPEARTTDPSSARLRPMLTAAVLLLVLHAPPPATDDDPRAFEGARGPR